MATTVLNPAAKKPLPPASSLSEVTLADKSGLTTQEAQTRLQKVGPNSMPSAALHPLRRMIDKLWAPVPWMLEAAIVLQIVLHKVTEAAVIAFLLFFNAALGFFQEGRAQATLAALKSRLALSASVQRDGAWKVIPSAELAPGDFVRTMKSVADLAQQVSHSAVDTEVATAAREAVNMVLRGVVAGGLPGA